MSEVTSRASGTSMLADDQPAEYLASRRRTNMCRDLSWLGAFFVAAGVPALVLFALCSSSACALRMSTCSYWAPVRTYGGAARW